MGIDDSWGVTSLVGLDGFVVCAQVHDGEQWWLAIETTATVAGCEACGSRAIGHGRRRVKVRDLPIVGEPVTLVWAKRIWRCPDSDCATKTWSESSEEIAPLGRCSPSGPGPRSPGGSDRDASRWRGWRPASGCRGSRR